MAGPGLGSAPGRGRWSKKRLCQRPDLLVNGLDGAQPALPVHTADHLPVQKLGGLEGAGAAGGQIAGVQLVDVGLGVGVVLTLAEQGDGAVSGHIQI